MNKKLSRILYSHECFVKRRKNTSLNIHVISCGCKTKIEIKLEFDLKEFQTNIELRKTPKAS